MTNYDTPGAYIGISLGSREFSAAYLRHVADVARRDYSSLLFLVADLPHAYTFVATKGLSYEEARRKALAIGDQKMRSAERAARSIPGWESFSTIQRWSS